MKTIVGKARARHGQLASRRPRPTHRPAAPTYERLRIVLRGAVQGVGFRPFIHRLATELKIKGWVSNCAQGVLIEAEGARHVLQEFRRRLTSEKPPRSMLVSIECSVLDTKDYGAFEIRQSESRGDKTALILPDIATCADCLRDILDPTNRRFRYPFTNCTNCGPRFSIIEELPYDRPHTSMKKFAMCEQCNREYHDPNDRRFHAQPNACPNCGPQLKLWDRNGMVFAETDDALRQAAKAVRAGEILALKGTGGFQLIVDGRSEEAVSRLRENKHREEKPFAVMCPSFEVAQAICQVSALESRLLLSPESPIVLMAKTGNKSLAIAPSVAPRNPNLGLMLPYTPLHHLLMRELNFPVVATSGNLSDEPICIDEHEAVERLRGVADCFLVHDRPIVRHVDDSIVRVISGREMVLRRARGYAPLPISIQATAQMPRRAILAVGAHLKNTVALCFDNNVFLSQHIGDLETEQAYQAFQRSARDLPHLYDAKIDIVACDVHPDYLSTKYARGIAAENRPAVNAAAGSRPSITPVQHHWAHVTACMAENEIVPPALGVAWDGTGHGLDGTIWGGEFLVAKPDGLFERVAHLRQFRLPGGEAAIRQPSRSAIGLLHEILGDDCWDLPHTLLDSNENERALLRQMLRRKVNAPLTSSVGRLFDVVSALTGLRQRANFEGQAAMELEFARRPGVVDAYSFIVSDTSPMILDWAPAIRELLDDVAQGEQCGIVSAKFHNMLVEMIVAIAEKIAEPKIVLTGGCFQNRFLTERAIERLREKHFQPYWHQRVPPNDGGIALGQVAAASWFNRTIS